MSVRYCEDCRWFRPILSGVRLTDHGEVVLPDMSADAMASARCGRPELQPERAPVWRDVPLHQMPLASMMRQGSNSACGLRGLLWEPGENVGNA